MPSNTSPSGSAGSSRAWRGLPPRSKSGSSKGAHLLPSMAAGLLTSSSTFWPARPRTGRQASLARPAQSSLTFCCSGYKILVRGFQVVALHLHGFFQTLGVHEFFPGGSGARTISVNSQRPRGRWLAHSSSRSSRSSSPSRRRGSPSFCISSAVIVILPGAMCGLWLALALLGYCLEKAFWRIGTHIIVRCTKTATGVDAAHNDAAAT